MAEKVDQEKSDHYERAMRTVQQACDGDPEKGHLRGDMLLCDLLIDLGYGNVVKEWSKIHKWYT